ncbi:MAG: PINc/VapC family ATPase [Halobacteriales archaeon]|nr:PINc/VapC family ATPase [Halobacteriales archaeon]
MDILPDTSAVIDGRVSEHNDVTHVYVPNAVVAELESQANQGRDSGWAGLEELQRLAEAADANELSVEYIGRRPTHAETEGAGEGDIDALIRELAQEHGATLLTSDRVQAEVGEAMGVTVEYVEPKVEPSDDTDDDPDDELDIERYFDDQTMSLHLKTGVVPMAKRGDIGDVTYGPIAGEPLSESEMLAFANDIESTARASSRGFVELEEPGMVIIQYADYRIAIARPPFADGIEITAVRPIASPSLDEYDLPDGLRDRFTEHQRGILLSGSPGAGKSTFAQAVAEFLASSDFAVKTMEKPRDLQVGDHITQYTELRGSMERTADSLLMVRPDYTIYDEVRKTSDFNTFADMRLAGVGMIGVVHATRAIDALQRLVGRVELGMIPQVVDTVVYIEAGAVDTVYEVETKVKVPHGLMEEDLTRPVVVISDYETGEPAYEIYTFNQQVVTVPLEDADEQESGVSRIAKNEIEREIKSIAHGQVEVEITSDNAAVVYVSENDISSVIGKGGGRITDIENRLGMELDVRTLDEYAGSFGGGDTSSSSGGGSTQGEPVTPDITSRHIILPVEGHAGETVEVQAGGQYLFTATVSQGGEVQISRGSGLADELETAVDRGQQVTITPQ